MNILFPSGNNSWLQVLKKHGVLENEKLDLNKLSVWLFVASLKMIFFSLFSILFQCILHG